MLLRPALRPRRVLKAVVDAERKEVSSKVMSLSPVCATGFRLSIPPRYAFPVVVAPPEMVSPPTCVPSPIVEEAVAKMFVRKEVPETESAVEDAYGNVEA